MFRSEPTVEESYKLLRLNIQLSHPSLDIIELLLRYYITVFFVHQKHEWSQVKDLVERGDIESLADVLQLPPIFTRPQGSVCDRIEGLCILLRRLAYPCRYSDMVSRFAKPVPVLCMVSNIVLNYIFDLHHHRITTWNNSILNPFAIQQYSDAVSDKCAALNNCFGFVDGTVRPICRPGEHQRLVYNGHKRVHALKFQAVALPNGLIGHLFGPVGKSSYSYSLFCFWF